MVPRGENPPHPASSCATEDGVGHGVFHPADHSIFNASVSSSRLGRAYGVYSICGNLGWVVATAVVVTLSAAMGWRLALVTVGVLGTGAAVALSTQGEGLHDRHETVGLRGVPLSGWTAGVRLLLATPILVAFAHFALVATSLIGIKTFSVPAVVAIYEVPLGLATGALTTFLPGSACGIFKVYGFVYSGQPATRRRVPRSWKSPGAASRARRRQALRRESPGRDRNRAPSARSAAGRSRCLRRLRPC
jgi:FSR family fosmidomycin resistance protein-like MFS transporter